MFSSPGIINECMPEKNKYTNFNNIETILFAELTSLQIQRMINLIRTNYLQNKENIFTPQSENIIPYLSGHNDKTFVSFYNEDYHMIDLKKGTNITDKKVIGIMTSRPIYIFINNGNKDATFRAYYIDYLCVDKLYRKKGIAPQIIQTHHYNQRQLNKNIVVSLFKREDELTGIVPLCVYSTYGFPVINWTKPPELSAEYKLLEINAQNFHFLFSFIKENSKKFDIVINTEVTNIIELIKTKNIFIYVIIVDDSIISAYFFRKSCVQIEKGMEVLSCFATISNTDDDILIQGFKISFWKIAAENMFGFAAIEDISDNYIIINNIKQKTKPLIISPTAYFFYNFAYHTFKSSKVLIIN
jgi:ribosomal protein S18 acetylase RimI-like enzyme